MNTWEVCRMRKAMILVAIFLTFCQVGFADAPDGFRNYKLGMTVLQVENEAHNSDDKVSNITFEQENISFYCFEPLIEYEKKKNDFLVILRSFKLNSVSPKL